MVYTLLVHKLQFTWHFGIFMFGIFTKHRGFTDFTQFFDFLRP